METTLIDHRRILESEEDPNRTAAIITPYRPFLNYDATYFEPYGVVETIRTGRTSGSFYIIIQFKDSKHALDLIAKCCILIDNNPFTVIPFRSNDEFMEIAEHITFTHPPYYSPPPPNRSEDNILNVLNDDCLGEIFKRAELSERPQIEEVCTRFKRVTEKAFISVYRRTKIDFTNLNPYGKVTLTEIDIFLHHFGSSIVSVKLHHKNCKHIADGFDSILKLMAKCCPNLRRLELHFDGTNNKQIENETLIATRPLLSKLNSFSIYHNLLSVCSAFIAACEDIEDLSMTFLEADSVLPEINLPKLKSCWFSEVHNTNKLPEAEGFLLQNPQIQTIFIIGNNFGLLRWIAEKVLNVGELKISTRLIQLDNLHLNSLEQAKISMYFPQSDFLLDNNPIETLSKNITLLYIRFVNAIDLKVIVELTKHLRNLKTLIINLCSDEHILSIDHLKEMLSYAKKLTMLLLSPIVHVLCEKDYDELLQTVQSHRNHPLKLNIKLYNEQCSNESTGNKSIVFNANPQWLTITTCYQI